MSHNRLFTLIAVVCVSLGSLIGIAPASATGTETGIGGDNCYIFTMYHAPKHYADLVGTGRCPVFEYGNSSLIVEFDLLASNYKASIMINKLFHKAANLIKFVTTGPDAGKLQLHAAAATEDAQRTYPGALEYSRGPVQYTLYLRPTDHPGQRHPEAAATATRLQSADYRTPHRHPDQANTVH